MPWKVDDLIIHKIVEEEKAYNTVEKFMPALDPQIVEENFDWFSKDGLEAETGKIFLSYHSFVVETPRHNVLIDSCIGNGKHLPIRDTWHNKSDTRWLDEFHATGLREDDIDFVLCTHLHADHVGWNTQKKNGIWTPTFRNARHLMVDKEYEFTRQYPASNPDSPLAPVFDATLAESVEPIIAAGLADFVSATHELDEYIRLLPTPGHTPGHVGVIAGRERDVAVFTGDLIHSPIQARYPDILMFTDDNPELASQTRRNFLTRFADTDTLVCTMHFPHPSVGYVKRWGDGFRLEYVEPISMQALEALCARKDA